MPSEAAAQVLNAFLEARHGPGARRHLVPYVIVSQRHVTPVGRRQLVQAEDGPAVFDRRTVEGKDPFDLAMEHQELAGLRTLGPERWALGDERLQTSGQD